MSAPYDEHLEKPSVYLVTRSDARVRLAAVKSYGQWCSVAKALDVVGERWSLLLVRELFDGPKRYVDLLDGSPGISTDVLAARLRDLEEAGVVQRRTLPPPAASKVYELTDRGRSRWE
jgi:DNA-binding HxlR family transcriptional regulator